MGISVTQLLIILGIILLLFGTKKLRNIGSDLGGAIKGFKKAVSDEGKEPEEQPVQRVEEVKPVQPTNPNTANQTSGQPVNTNRA